MFIRSIDTRPHSAYDPPVESTSSVYPIIGDATDSRPTLYPLPSIVASRKERYLPLADDASSVLQSEALEQLVDYRSALVDLSDLIDTQLSSDSPSVQEYKRNIFEFLQIKVEDMHYLGKREFDTAVRFFGHTLLISLIKDLRENKETTYFLCCPENRSDTYVCAHIVRDLFSRYGATFPLSRYIRITPEPLETDPELLDNTANPDKKTVLWFFDDICISGEQLSRNSSLVRNKLISAGMSAEEAEKSIRIWVMAAKPDKETLRTQEAPGGIGINSFFRVKSTTGWPVLTTEHSPSDYNFRQL